MLKNFSFSTKHIHKKNINIYGGTGTGKTTVIKDILNTIKNTVPLLIVICPTENQHKTYTGGDIPIIEKIYYHDIPSEKLIDDILDRQKKASKYYDFIRNEKELRKIFYKTNDETAIKEVARLEKKKIKLIDALKSKSNGEHVDVKSIEEDHSETLMDIYIVSIASCKKRLLKCKLSTENLERVEHINFNPRLAIVMDDVTPYLKALTKAVALKKLYYEGRHYHITLITSCHELSAFTPAIRSNAQVSIFTDSKIAQNFYNNVNSGYSTSERKLICKYTNDMINYKCLINIEGKNFCYYVAKRHEDFTFGHPAFRKLAKKISKKTHIDGHIPTF